MLPRILFAIGLAVATASPAMGQLLMPDSVRTVVTTSFATDYETDFVGPAEFGLGAGFTAAGVVHRVSDRVTLGLALGNRSLLGLGSGDEWSWNARAALDYALPVRLPGEVGISAGAFATSSRRGLSQRRTDVFEPLESQSQLLRGGAHVSLYRLWSWGRLAVAPTLRAEADLGLSSFEVNDSSGRLNDRDATLAGTAAVLTLPVSLRLARGLHLNGGVSLARIHRTTLNVQDASYADATRTYFLGLSYGF